MLTIAVITRIDPRLGPPALRASARDRLRALRNVWGPAVLFLLVIGGLYFGVFSPTEAASIGAVGALLLGVSEPVLSTVQGIARSLLETVKTTAMIFTILIGAILFNNFLILASMPSLVSGWITGLPLGKTAILLVIIGMYFVLGCLLDSLAMILLTIPIVFPIVKALGYDPVWFGIIIVMVVELGLITPPIGMNVFVIKGIARDVPLETIFRGVTPFIVAQIILILILIAFPGSRCGCPRRWRAERLSARFDFTATDRYDIPTRTGRREEKMSVRPQVIALEEHYLDPEVKPHSHRDRCAGTAACHGPARRCRPGPHRRDGRAGIDMQVLSHGAPSGCRKWPMPSWPCGWRAAPTTASPRRSPPIPTVSPPSPCCRPPTRSAPPTSWNAPSPGSASRARWCTG